VPIIAITADADATTRVACLGVGMNEVLTKPVLLEHLAKAIATHCGGAMVASAGSKPLLNPQASSDLGGDPERARQYRKLLLQDIDEELQSLQVAIDGDDRNRIGRAAHSLKGLCGHLANPEPAELAAWLQQHALSADAEQLRLMAGQLQAACQRLLAQEHTP
jgi:HPt (histidine-containing phosphotransfer) domain-containing protein